MMSRMIFACCALVFASGCNHCTSIAHQVSLAKARVESHAPSGIIFAGKHGDCDDTIPHRPWMSEYDSCCDDHNTRYTAELSGFRAYRQYQSECGQHLSHHFKSGFITAFEDLALNRRPRPPIVPPPRYWNAFYRSCAGQPYVDEWFAGYDAGLSVGYNSGVSRFSEISLRRGNCGGGAGGGYQDQAYDKRNTIPQQSSAPGPRPVPQSQPQPVPQPTTVLPRDMPNPYAPGL